MIQADNINDDSERESDIRGQDYVIECPRDKEKMVNTRNNNNNKGLVQRSVENNPRGVCGVNHITYPLLLHFVGDESRTLIDDNGGYENIAGVDRGLFDPTATGEHMSQHVDDDATLSDHAGSDFSDRQFSSSIWEDDEESIGVEGEQYNPQSVQTKAGDAQKITGSAATWVNKLDNNSSTAALGTIRNNRFSDLGDDGTAKGTPSMAGSDPRVNYDVADESLPATIYERASYRKSTPEFDSFGANLLPVCDEPIPAPAVSKSTDILEVIESASRNHNELHYHIKKHGMILPPFPAPARPLADQSRGLQSTDQKRTIDIQQMDKAAPQASQLTEKLGLRQRLFRVLFGYKKREKQPSIDSFSAASRFHSSSSGFPSSSVSFESHSSGYQCQESDTLSNISPRPSLNSANFWRDIVDPAVYSLVSDEEKVRQEIIFEITRSESNYYEHLTSAIQVFEYPIREVISKKWSESDKNAEATKMLLSIFDDFRAISALSKEFMGYLTDPSIKRGHSVVSVAKPFLQILPKIPEVYICYARKQANFRLLMKRIQKKYSIFKKVISDCEKNKKLKRLSLFDFIHMPTTHLGRYKLFLQKLLDKTISNEQERVNLRRAVTDVCAILSEIDQTIMKELRASKLRILRDNMRNVYGNNYITRMIYSLSPDALLAEGPLEYGMRRVGFIPVEAYITDDILIVIKSPLKCSRNEPPVLMVPCGLIISTYSGRSIRERYDILGYNASNDTEQATKSSSSRGTASGDINNSSTPDDLNNVNPAKANAQQSLRDENLIFVIETAGKSLNTLFFRAMSAEDLNIWILEIGKLISKRRLLQKPFVTRRAMASPIDSKNRALCALCYGDHLFLGTKEGLLMSNRGISDIPSNCSGQAIALTPIEITRLYGDPRRVLEKIDFVSRVFCIPECNALIFVSRRKLWACPLDMILSSKPGVMLETKYCQKIASCFDSVHLDSYDRVKLIIIVKKQSYSSTIRIYQPSNAESPAKSPDCGDRYPPPYRIVRLSVIKKLYAPGHVTKVKMFGEGLLIYSDSNRSVEIIDIKTTRAHEYPIHVDRYIKRIRADTNSKAVEFLVIRNDLHLLCFSRFALFFDSQERRIACRSPIYWLSSPNTFVKTEYGDKIYVVAFSEDLIEIWDADSGCAIQNFIIHELRFISMIPEHLIFVTDKTNGPSGQIIRVVDNAVLE